MTDYEIQCLRRKIQQELGFYLPHNRLMAFAYDEKGALSAKCMYSFNEDEPVDEQNNVIINGKKYKVLSVRDTVIFYLQDLYDNTVRDIHEVERKMREAEDTIKGIAKSLNRINDLIEKIGKNVGKINDLDQTLQDI